MKLNYTDGCVCTSLTVDGVETIDLEFDTFKNVIKRFLTFGRDKNFKILLTCICRLIYETYYNTLKDDEEEELYENMNKYDCYVNNNHYEYIEQWDENNTYRLIKINKKIWNNILSDRMYDDMCYLIDNIDDISVLQSIFCSVMEHCGEYKCSEQPCECCGDFIRSYNLEID